MADKTDTDASNAVLLLLLLWPDVLVEKSANKENSLQKKKLIKYTTNIAQLI